MEFALLQGADRPRIEAGAQDASSVIDQPSSGKVGKVEKKVPGFVDPPSECVLTIDRGCETGSTEALDASGEARYAGGSTCSCQRPARRCPVLFRSRLLSLFAMLLLVPVGLALALPKVRLDQYGDPLPEGAVARIGSNRLRHANMVIGLAFAPDGKSFATCGWDNLVRVWETRTGRQLRQFEGHKKAIYCNAISPDGKFLASAGQEETIRLWDYATGKRVREFSGVQPSVSRLAFSPDGKLLASGGEDKTVHLWDVATGKEVRRLEGHTQRLWGIHFSPDGKRLASGGTDGLVRLWDVTTGKEVGKLEGAGGEINAVRFSPDGKQVAAAGGNGVAVLWDAATRKQIRNFGAAGGTAWPVSFSPDGKTLALGTSGGSVSLWEIATGQKKLDLPRHSQGVPRVEFSPNGKVLVSVSHDHSIRMWDAAIGKELPISRRHNGAITSAALAPDGKLLATTGGDRVVRLWDTATGKGIDELTGHRGVVTEAAFSPDGRLILTAGQYEKPRLWDAATRKPVRDLEGAVGGVTALAISPDAGRAAVAQSRGNRVLLWDLMTGRQLDSLQTQGPVSFLTFAPSGRVLAAAGPQQIDLYDARSRRWVQQVRGPGGQLLAMAFSPDSRLIASAWSDGNVWLSETLTGRPRLRLETKAGIKGLTFAASGRLLLTAGDDRSIRVWDVSTGKSLQSIKGHTAAVTCLSLSANEVLVSGSADSTALVWDAHPWLKVPPTPPENLAEAELTALWKILEGEDGIKAHEAIRRLGASDRSAGFLAARLKPAVEVLGKGRVERLIAQLDNRRFATRERATRELERIAPLAEEALRKALADKPSPEARRRLEGILERVGRWAPTPDEVQAVRAIEALEHLGTTEARHLLEKMANGAPESCVSQDAKAALGRLPRQASGQ
jgi:WD40 repeat protein